MSYQVFISFKNLDASGQPTRDSQIAAELYRQLKARGVNVFFSNEEVQRKCRPDYGDLIDEALESSKILLLVGTSVDYIESKWVKYEWNSFKNEINSGRKDGYIIPILEGVSVGQLPFALRHGQVYTSAQMDDAVSMVVGVLGVSAPVTVPASAPISNPSQSVEVMYETGEDYYYGRNGKSQNYTEAVRWYRKAAERGYAAAQNSLGYCYYNGEGVEKNAAEAVSWYRKAAEQGDADAQNALGNCYRNGSGVVKNAAGAVKWYRKAAEQGLARAQCNLGTCYRIGNGVPKDIKQAKHWYGRAAAQGYALAKENLEQLK